jgi:hypothetical protein
MPLSTRPRMLVWHASGVRSTVSFVVASTLDSVPAVSASVDGAPLSGLIERYEASHGYSPAGGYGGLVPDYFNFGDLVAYLFGQAARQYPAPGRAYLLGCGDCGEVGCWPLEASIVLDEHMVTWSNFAQPHRRERDYSEFGPFVFDRAQYAGAVREAREMLHSGPT